MSSFTKILLLSSALAAVAVSAQDVSEQGRVDPCTILNKATTASNVTYQQVANCYKSIPFDTKQAKDTIDSLTTFYNDDFVFRDVATTPNLPSPFTLKPVDTMAELKRIGRTRYSRDWDFHNDLALLSQSYQDAHSIYAPQCYTSYFFIQPLTLYAPVVNGRQTIRVFEDETKSGLEGCEVLKINGRNARSEIQAFADKHTGFSKDAGVRFNYALSNKMYWTWAKIWLDAPGMFSLRRFLPDTPFIQYTLKCQDEKTHEVRGDWIVLPHVEPNTFTDRATFVSNFCARSKEDAKPKEPKQSGERVEPNPWTNLLAAMYEFRHGSKPDSSLKDLPGAKQVDGDNTAAYQLKSQPHVGVLVVPSMDYQSKTEIPAVQRYMKKLADNGATHLILDMTGNMGGEEEFASLLPAILFKTKDKATFSHKIRYRINPAMQKLAEASMHTQKPLSSQNYWDPKTLRDLQFKPFTSNPFTKDTVNLTYHGRTATYSQQLYLDFNMDYVDSSATYPWSNDPSKIIILTNGLCGSACGFTTAFFNAQGVKAIAVGGHQGKPLSMFSFPGASVIDAAGYIANYNEVGVEPPFKQLPYENPVTVGVRILYVGNDTQPFEYNPARFPAAHRLNFEPNTAHNQDELWAEVAKVTWKL
ncbi:hypothetical protein B0O80DRAFT_84754 [Mortierella sp. GBAus27b]|nr:hypothetical protein BGX31_001767 [Mortierella sp. GBA43]KAI8352257.1 hypothetical protein B0O80DRAFT_84754 [Mortierella sp. GBAus27b]